MKCIERIAQSYLHRSSRDTLQGAANDLRYVAKNGGSWTIPIDRPIRTKLSKGCYEPDGKGGYQIEGRLSFIWDMTPADRGKFELTGNASTLVSIYSVEEDKDTCIFCWNVDIASLGGSVGPKFHTQIHNPHELSVPRFPALAISPADCLDFLLGEIFIERWPHHQSTHNDTQRFCNEQSKRLRAILSGLSDTLKSSDDQYSALLQLKHWKPKPDLFQGL